MDGAAKEVSRIGQSARQAKSRSNAGAGGMKRILLRLLPGLAIGFVLGFIIGGRDGGYTRFFRISSWVSTRQFER